MVACEPGASVLLCDDKAMTVCTDDLERWGGSVGNGQLDGVQDVAAVRLADGWESFRE